MPFDANEAWLSGFRVDLLPEWTCTKLPPMRQKRFLHAAIKLDDFRILVIGGKCEEDHLACTELYDSQTDTWTDWPELNEVRSGHAAVFHNNTIYVFGGYNNKDYLVSIESLHLSCKNSKWNLLNAKLSCKRSGCAAVVVGPLIYIMGGYESRSDWASIDILDTTTGKIRKGPSMTTARSGCASAVINNTIHVVGGNDAHGMAPKTIETLSIGKSNQWNVCTSKMSTARCFPAVAVVAHCLVVMGGHDGDNNSFLSSVEVFDTKKRVWWRLPDMIKSRYGCAAVTLGESRVVVVGGTCESEKDADSVESLHLFIGEDTEAKSPIDEIRERLELLELTVQSMSERLSQAERKRREEFQAIMSQLMQIKNAQNNG